MPILISPEPPPVAVGPVVSAEPQAVRPSASAAPAAMILSFMTVLFP
ncbi:hypothetical protein ACFQGX_33065 [Nonomuraea dietziae]